MMKGVMGQQNSYMTVNWGAFDHAPQLRSCNYYYYIYIYIYIYICNYYNIYIQY